MVLLEEIQLYTFISFKIQNENCINIIAAPSDHLITNEEEFNRIVKECLEQAVEDCLITLGINLVEPKPDMVIYNFLKKFIKKLLYEKRNIYRKTKPRNC